MTVEIRDATFLHTPDSTLPHCHCPSLCWAGERLACVWYAYPRVEHEHARLAMAIRDHGEWSRTRTLPIADTASLGNPCLLWDAATAAWWLWFVALRGPYWNHAEVMVCRSADDGRSWSHPRPLGLPRGTMLRHPPSWVGGRYLFALYDERSNCLRLLASTRLDEEWRDLGLILPGCIQARIVVRDDERLELFARPAQSPNRVRSASSQDGGRNWSTAAATELPCPLSGIDVVGLGDQLFLAHNHTHEHRRTPLSLSRRAWAGGQWEAPVHLDENPIELSYPSMVAGADGSLQIAYTYNRRMIKHLELQVRA